MKLHRKSINAAIDLYKSFREKLPRRIMAVRMRIPKAVAVIGHLEAVDYVTTHGNKATLYRHTFAPGSRPLLCASSDGKQLLLLGGRFKFTDRGIVDRDHKGREIDEPRHGEDISTDPWDERTPSVLRRQANSRATEFKDLSIGDEAGG